MASLILGHRDRDDTRAPDARREAHPIRESSGSASGSVRLRRKRDRRDVVLRQWLLDDVHGRFLSQPGLTVTATEAVRLFRLREDICWRVLQTLSARGLLCESAPGRYHSCEETRPPS